MKELRYLFSLILGLATWIKLVVYFLFSAFVTAVAGYFGPEAAGIAALLCLALLLLLVANSFLMRWLRARRAAELRGELDSSGLRLSRQTDATGAVEELHTAFFAGLEKFKPFGNNYYELPWFAIVGEGGCGKTQAFLNSRIDLPAGLHDAGQGNGPTAGLDWWFTNFAVVLDTAGSVLFSPSEGPTTPQWTEFARLLKKHRRKCPLNGIILAISLESLLRDSPHEVDAKAGVIARHLDTLQAEIGVRMPVFLLVTKCDTLPGFSSYFKDLPDTKAQNQMLGWSNPAPLEAPFRPELVDEHFRVLAQRLRRRRLGLLFDPVPAEAGRRLDEVDTLFSLPETLLKILPNLHRYAESIFVAGEWSFRPLFLRGIYLTSAGPEPAGAEAPSEPGGGARFLRDVFLDKIFREDSLVTAVGTGARERFRRRMAIFLLGVAGLAALMWLAFVAHNSFLRVQESQLGLWSRGTSGWTTSGWTPIVAPGRSGVAEFRFEGNQTVGTGLPDPSKGRFAEQALTLVGYHKALAKAASQPLPVPWIFEPLTWLGTNPDTARSPAQLVLFEAGVVKPLLEAAREKMSKGTMPNPLPVSLRTFDSEVVLTEEAKALTELVRVEVAIVGRTVGKYSTNPGSTFIPSLLDYVSGQPDSAGLTEVMNWSFTRNPAGIRRWAPAWASGGNSLQTNTAISAGIDRLVAYSKQRLDELEKNLAALQDLADVVSKYSAAEQQLAKAASIKDDLATSENAVANAYEGLEASKIQLEGKLTGIKALGLFEDGPETLSSALGRLASSSDSHLGQVDLILQSVDSVLPPPPDTSDPKKVLSPNEWDSSKYNLLKEIKARLTGIAGLIQSKIHDKITDQLVANYRSLDQAVLDPYQGTPGYLWRWANYGKAAAGAPQFHFYKGMYLVDQRWVQLGELLEALDELQAKVDLYSGQQATDFLTICNYFLRRTETEQTRLFMANYIQQARAALLRVARFPLVSPPGSENEALSPDQLQGAKSLLRAISADLQEETFTQLPPATIQPVLDFYKRIAPLFGVVDSLIKQDGTFSSVTVTLYNGQAQKQLSGPNFAPMPTPAPSPTPPPRSLVSKMFFGLGSKPTPAPDPGTPIDVYNWNAVGLVGSASGVFPLSSQSDVQLGVFHVQDAFSFQVYHSLVAGDGSDVVSGGNNWSALRLIARLGGKPVGIGQDWQVALKPNEPNSVWVKFSFDLPLPSPPWPTIDSLGLRQLPGQPISQNPAIPPAS